jgi:hypothetical protein
VNDWKTNLDAYCRKRQRELLARELKDLAIAVAVAAVMFAPFVVYFWRMKP